MNKINQNELSEIKQIIIEMILHDIKRDMLNIKKIPNWKFKKGELK